LYYELNTSIIHDSSFDKWGRELVQLQHDYPEDSRKLPWAREFEGWDATTGYHLPTRDPQIMAIANHLLKLEKERNNG
jgi:NAD-dependent DNA ligase (contains BRCT domain type II)